MECVRVGGDDVFTEYADFTVALKWILITGIATLKTGFLPLIGKKIAIKDTISTLTMSTTCSSALLQGFSPSYDATAVRLIAEAGGDVYAKTNCDEFGMGSANVYSVHGPVFNPFQPLDPVFNQQVMERRSAGGSSGGSAAAVAADDCYAALGTDTGGSIRLPASYCGVVGFKPSYGLVSRWGVVAFADSLDCVGILANSVSRIVEVFGVIRHYDPKDPTSIPKPIRKRAEERSVTRLGNWSRLGAGQLKTIRIGVPQEYFPAELEPTVHLRFRQILKALKCHGAELSSVNIPSTRLALSAYYVLASAEASSNLARYDGVRFGLPTASEADSNPSQTSKIYASSRSAGFGSEVQKRVLLGSHALTADAFDNYFLRAQRVRQAVKADFDAVFACPNELADGTDRFEHSDGVDILLHPTAIRTAPRLADVAEGLDGYLQDVMTTPASLAGLPAINLPGVFGSDGWPLGLSVVGQWGSDDALLGIAEVIGNIMTEHVH